MSEFSEYVQIIVTTVIVPIFLYVAKIEKKLVKIDTTLCYLKKEIEALKK